MSSPVNLSPIRQLLELDENTDLVNGPDLLVDGFNKEVSEFKEILTSKNQQKVIKIDK
ncbi:hypothetical protein J7438_15410 [Thalassotalea sp. G20_0]|uniref:hypothetical protein n=1 Tax=Thalassotalea sp. G20_0 TaxID=2821093 RepID=UPI001AD95A6B|nr:hypothetical protein [Thalassotalea sp. G20_0]MBO9495466.1 hypothetical protein [Thalassotalea sp. G20_0]